MNFYLMNNPKIIAVIGPNADKCSEQVYQFGLELGRALVDAGYLIACGGKFGLMEAVCKGAHQSEGYQFGKTIGIIPSSDKAEANSYCDIVIPTGLGIARNTLLVNAADRVIAVAGGAGTLSELAMAWQLGKKVICYTGFEGWSKALAGKAVDQSNREMFKDAASIKEILQLLVDEN